MQEIEADEDVLDFVYDASKKAFVVLQSLSKGRLQLSIIGLATEDGVFHRLIRKRFIWYACHRGSLAKPNLPR